jgi:hypothetical protein
MKAGTLVSGYARSLSGFDGNASFETPPLAAPQDKRRRLVVRRPKAISNHESGTLVGGYARSLSGFDGTASFETPPVAAPQDKRRHIVVRRPKAVSNHESSFDLKQTDSRSLVWRGY